MLVRASQRENVKVRDIAQRIVADATQDPSCAMPAAIRAPEQETRADDVGS